MKKKNAFFSSLLLIITFLFSLESCYLLQQGCTLISTQSKAKKIDRLLEDKTLDPELRELFLLVKRIKEYAVEELGLKNDKNYTTYIEIDKDYIADVVSACKKEAFKPYTWWYPFFGSFPYKGFFKREDALEEADALRKKNLDVLVRQVDAFSTLGYFTDPLYSFMTEYSAYSLASIIIHEQTHATIWVIDQVQFNEELATFVGQEGALLFLKDAYGEHSEEYSGAIAKIDDNKRFISHMKTLYRDLNALYTMDIDPDIKRKIRGYIIHAFKERFRSIYYREFHNKNYKNIASFSMNNAYIMLFITYTEDLSFFYHFLDMNDGDLKETIALFKENLEQIKAEKGNPKEYLKKKYPGL
ncbi:MAG: aminopeptidase [Spirochaetales bacterium]|nr:aminopeptidase [Spirochaetales bacterium]